MKLPIVLRDIEEASDRLKNLAVRTPVLQSAHVDALVGARVFFKCENLQRTGSFKFRGALNALAQFSEEQRTAGVVSYSSGNHAQGVAHAAALLRIPSVIVMPSDAPRTKMEATRAYQREGGLPRSRVIEYDRFKENRERIADALAKEEHLTLIPPFDHPHIMAGQGTATLELLQQVGEPLDVLFVCCGGGGLLSGAAVAANGVLGESCKVYGVEPEKGNDTQQSFASGEIVTIKVPETIADGAQTTHPGNLTFSVVKSLCSGIVTVTDEQLMQTMAIFARHLKLVVEPTGCLAAAAAIFNTGNLDLKGKRIGVIVSGGNVDLDKYTDFIRRGAGLQ